MPGTSDGPEADDPALSWRDPGVGGGRRGEGAASFSAGLEDTLPLSVAEPGNACTLPLGPWVAATSCAQAHNEKCPPPAHFCTQPPGCDDPPVSRGQQALQRPQG